MRAASSQAVDRLLGVFVAVCASAVIAAFGARIGPSFSAFLRLAYDGYASTGESSAGSEEGRGDCSKKRCSRGPRRSSPDNEDSRRQDSNGEGDNVEMGDEYFAYAYGSRSSSLRSGTAMGVATGDAAAVAGRRGLGAVLVVHAGSCHCGELAFEVQAPEHLVALEGRSKMRYPFITVPSEHFRLTSDDRNGSLYLLKNRPSSGRDNTLKVSAHLFCRRCGVHVVHAPDFPQAVVANVNVHCIHPGTMKSLAVAFLRGGGAEVPGMGDPVEGMYEVGRESWPDAMRERVSVALQQPLVDPMATVPGNTIKDTRELSPRRRSASLTSPPAWGSEGRGVYGRGHGESGIKAAGGSGTRGGVSVDGAGDVTRTHDLSALRRTAVQRDVARQYPGGLSSSDRSSPPTAGGRGNTSSSWEEVLMHMASLPSSVQSRNKSMSNGVAGSSSYSSGNINQLANGDWGQRTSEMLLRAEREHRVALGIGSGGSGGEFSIRGSGTGDSGDTSREAAESKWVEDNAGANKLPRNSPSPPDSCGASNPAAVGSPADGVSSRGNGEEASGGSCNSTGDVLLKDNRSRSGDTGDGSDAARVSNVSSDPTQQGESGRELEVLVRPPPLERVSAGFDARKA